MKSLPIVLLFFGLTVNADVVKLSDGTRVEGDVKRDGDEWVVTQAGGKVVRVPKEKVQGIELGAKTPAVVPGAGPAIPGLDRLLSLRRSCDNLPDIHQVLQRYEKFIEQNKGTPLEAEARKDVAMWQERLDRGLVRLGGKWITAEQRKKLAESSALAADQARSLIIQNRLKEADPILVQALDDDPQNAAAWFLRGLLLQKLDQAPAARKCYETANTLLPDYAPILNNLANILWRQKQHVGAIKFYDLAMQAAPQNIIILNNVAEALNGLEENSRTHATVLTAVRHFNEQDQPLQAKMAQLNLFRWGATWVSKAEMEKLKAAEAKVQAQIDAYEREFNDNRQKIAKIEDDLSENQRQMMRIEASSYTRTTTGVMTRVSLPPVYYDLARDSDRLQADRTRVLKRQEELRDLAKQVQQNLPTPRYSGVHTPIGPEGTPGAQPKAASTTQPATKP